MAANPKKGTYGALKAPRTRLALLRRYASLSLTEAGLLLGVGQERARQLYRLYGVPRTPVKVLRWTSLPPVKNGWWFMRWKSDPKHWFVAEVYGETVQCKGLHVRTTRRARGQGAQWMGPLIPPRL